MTILKPLELAFRRGLIRFLGRVAARRGGSKEIPEQAKVLLLRQDRIGDVLVSTAIVHALAKTKPGWQLDMLFGRSNLNILEHDPVVRKRWFYDKRIGNTVKLIRALRREKYDVVIDLMDNPSATSTALLALAGGAVNVGLEKDNGFAYDIVVPMRSRENTHTVERLADMLRAVGCDVRDDELRMVYTPAEASRRVAKDFFSRYRVGNKKFCSVNTSAGALDRFWGVENYRAFLSEATKIFSELIFFVAAQPSDRARAEKICEGIEGVVLLPSSPEFDLFAAFLEQTDIVISPDTSVVHLASALGKPQVVIFTTKALATNWSPYAVPYRAVISQDGLIGSIAPHDVVTALQSLLFELNPE